MVGSPSDYDEAYERFADDYFISGKITSGATRDERSAEFLKQLGDMDKIGLVLATKDQYRHANYLYRKIAGESLSREAWEARDLSKFLRKVQARERNKERGVRSPYRRRDNKIFGFETWKDGKQRVVARDARGRFVKR